MPETFTSNQINKEFDHDHHELLNQIKKLCDKISNNSQGHEIIFLISEIHAVISSHFKKEEKILKQLHDENFTGHKVDHDELLAMLKHTLNNPNELSGHTLGPSLFDRCQTRLSKHFEEFDVQGITKMADARISISENP